jgi:hypothetical protein
VKSRAQTLAEKLDSNKRGYKFLKYPMDIETEGTQNIMLININAMSGSKFSGQKYRQIEGDTAVMQQQGSNSLARSFTGNTVRIDTAIALHMPASVEASYQSNWSATNLGTVGAVMDAWQGSGDIGDFQAWKNNWMTIKETLPEILKMTGVKVADTLLPGEIKGAYTWANRMVENPYVEVLFEGVSNRTFNFTFKMIAKSKQEQEMIKQIINTLKFHRAPEKKLGRANLYWSYPSTFDISFLKKNGQKNDWLFNISTCALTELNISQGGDGHFASHEDGSPFMTTITLAFTELEVLTKERIQQGF